MYNVNKEKRDTKVLMVETAIDLFKQRGTDAVSVSDICQTAGVTRNAFYYHFKNKELLFDDIGDWISRTAKQRVLAGIGSSSHYQQFWEFYLAYIQVMLDLGPDIVNHVCISRTGKGAADPYSYIDETLAPAMTRLLELSQKEGLIGNPTPAQDLLWTSYAIVRGVNIKWCFQWGACDIVGETRRDVDILCLPRAGCELV